MKLLLDNNLGERLLFALKSSFPESSHVRHVGLGSALDVEIWTYAKEHGFVILLKDRDFADLAILKGHPPKAIWLRVGNCSSDEALAAIMTNFDSIAEFDGSLEASLLVIPPSLVIEQ